MPPTRMMRPRMLASAPYSAAPERIAQDRDRVRTRTAVLLWQEAAADLRLGGEDAKEVGADERREANPRDFSGPRRQPDGFVDVGEDAVEALGSIAYVEIVGIRRRRAVEDAVADA